MSAASFLAAFLLYDLQDVGIASDQLILPCAILSMAGILLAFKALEVWSGWQDDTSEDLNVSLNRSNLYPVTFYTEATLGLLIVIFLLVFTLIRNWPTVAEDNVLLVALALTAACFGMGQLSQWLE